MGIVDLLICLKVSLCHHIWSNRIDSFFLNDFFVSPKQKERQCVYTYFIWLFFWGGRGELRLPFLFLQPKKVKVSVAYGSFIRWRWACWDAGDDLWFSKLHLRETECSFDYWRLEMSYYGSRMALDNFPATIGCGRVLIDLPQEDFVVV